MSEKPSALDAVKIQARVVIPIVRALEREIGTERAHFIGWVGRSRNRMRNGKARSSASETLTRGTPTSRGCSPRSSKPRSQMTRTRPSPSTSPDAGSPNTSTRSVQPTSGLCSLAVSTSQQSRCSAPIGSFAAPRRSWAARTTAISGGGCKARQNRALSRGEHRCGRWRHDRAATAGVRRGVRGIDREGWWRPRRA